jgi:hypothetical protein
MLLVVTFDLVDSLGSLDFCWAYVGFSRILLSLVFYLNLEYLVLRYHLALLSGFRDPAYLKPLFNVFRQIGHLKTHRVILYVVQTKGVMFIFRGFGSVVEGCAMQRKHGHETSLNTRTLINRRHEHS